MADRRQLSLGFGEASLRKHAPAALPEVARLIGLGEEEIPQLGRILLDRISNPSAYRLVKIPKKLGGWRELEIPNANLMRIQRAIHHTLLKPRYMPSPICHSFIGRRAGGSGWLPGRSIVSNAYAHLGVPSDAGPDPEVEGIPWRIPRSIVGFDLQDAYPSVSQLCVFQIFQRLSEDPWAAAILATLTTWKDALPQGAPTSPLLMNFACQELDQALEAAFGREPFCVTRYVDDITTTSLDYDTTVAQEQLVELIEGCGFRAKPEKIISWQAGERRFHVTGIALIPEQHRVALPRSTLDRLGLLLYHSVRVLRTYHLLKIATSDVTGRYALAKAAKRARGRALGVLGLAYLIYGDEPPDRIFRCLRRPRVRADGFTDELADTARRNPPSSLIYDVMEEVSGYRSF